MIEDCFSFSEEWEQWYLSPLQREGKGPRRPTASPPGWLQPLGVARGKHAGAFWETPAKVCWGQVCFSPRLSLCPIQTPSRRGQDPGPPNVVCGGVHLGCLGPGECRDGRERTAGGSCEQREWPAGGELWGLGGAKRSRKVPVTASSLLKGISLRYNAGCPTATAVSAALISLASVLVLVFGWFDSVFLRGNTWVKLISSLGLHSKLWWVVLCWWSPLQPC